MVFNEIISTIEDIVTKPFDTVEDAVNFIIRAFEPFIRFINDLKPLFENVINLLKKIFDFIFTLFNDSIEVFLNASSLLEKFVKLIEYAVSLIDKYSHIPEIALYFVPFSLLVVLLSRLINMV